ncbi:Sushi domain-containing protein 3 [Labeo rohita]|uniref:Sushi domain-containing protein 3 n=1 Tax=Labeo rohita TaxID=84645 RepID=A0ABQ8MRX8_LABRO|nr:Sushi domain-containing protein 3 [Labeo rohita]
MALKESCLTWGFLLWSMTWNSARTFTPDEGSSVSPIFHRTTATETLINSTEAPTNNYTGVCGQAASSRPPQLQGLVGLSCTSLLPPRRGSFYVEKGTGMSVGTVLAFWCLEGYQLVGSEKITCVLRSDTAQWSNYPPDCEAIPRPEDRGLRVAVLASVVSSIVILAMSVSFIICCLQERMSKERTERTDGRGRMRDKRKSSWRSECWLERDEGDWEAFPPPKIYNLSQHLDPHLTPESPVYMGGLAGYDNRGYQSQMYPHVVLQRVPTPTVPTAPSAPVYLHLSTPSPTESPIEQPALPLYPSATPQRLWP